MLNPTTTSPTSTIFMLPNAFLTSFPIRIIHCLSSSVIEASSIGWGGLGAAIVLTSCWYFNDRSPKSKVVIDVHFEFNSLMLIVFLAFRSEAKTNCTPESDQRFVWETPLPGSSLANFGIHQVDVKSLFISISSAIDGTGDGHYSRAALVHQTLRQWFLSPERGV